MYAKVRVGKNFALFWKSKILKILIFHMNIRGKTEAEKENENLVR